MSHKANYWLASLSAEQVKAGAFRVLFHLCDHHNDDRDPLRACFPSQDTLREKTGLSNGALNAALNAMEEDGLIQRRRSTIPGTRTPRTYYILGCDFHLLPEQTPETGVCSNSGLPESENSTDSGGPEPDTEQTPVFGRTNSGGPESILKGTITTTTDRPAETEVLALRCLSVCGPGLSDESRRVIRETDAVLIGWIEAGADLERDVLPVLQGRTASARPDTVIRTWDYFTAAIRRQTSRRLREGQGRKIAENSDAPCRNAAPGTPSDQLRSLADWINSGSHVPSSAVSNLQRDELLHHGLVTRERLRQLQIY